MENSEKSMLLLLLGVVYSLGTIYVTYLVLNFLHLVRSPTTDIAIAGVAATLMLLSFVGVFITAAAIRTARDSASKRPGLWKSCNLLAGTIAMMLNIGLLWMKSHPEHVRLWYPTATPSSASADTSR